MNSELRRNGGFQTSRVLREVIFLEDKAGVIVEAVFT